MAHITTSAPLPVGADRTAEDRIRRLFARFISTGFVFYLLVLIPSIVEQSALTHRWWTPVAVALFFVPGIGMGVVSFLRDRRWIGICGGTAAVGYLVGVALFPLARLPHSHPVDFGNLWFQPIAGLGTLASVLAWRWWLVSAHLVIAAVLSVYLNHATLGNQQHGPLLPDVAFSMMYCSVFVAASLVALRTGRLLDETRADTHARAASAAASAARMAERERIDGLIHDGVMSTLLAISRIGNNTGLAHQSQMTLQQLDGLRSGSDSLDTFDATTVLALFRSAATDVDENVRVTDEHEPESALLEVQPAVARTIAAALAEALRNSVRHAHQPGWTVTRTVAVTLGATHVLVEVIDDGCGFDPTQVPEHRLGLAVSINARMRQLDGGSAVVHSRPGAGTRVVLAWTR